MESFENDDIGNDTKLYPQWSYKVDKTDANYA